MAVFTKPEDNTTMIRQKKREVPEGLFTKCTGCGEVAFHKELVENLRVCPSCDYHFPMGAYDRIASLVDPDSWKEYDAHLSSVDVLEFKGATSYAERLKIYQKKTQLHDAVVNGTASIEGSPLSLAAMDFNFLGGSMGSVVGEKITRTLERAAKLQLPCLLICASGGARMHEGMLSLMQMAKTSGAVAKLNKKKLPFFTLLTNPTMGGVTASFATLGDLILAEPKAMIGFAGARVIKETTHQDLPEGFQTSEFLLAHGLIDRIIPRHQLRSELGKLLRYFGASSSHST